MSAVANSTVPVQLESINTGNPVSESAIIAMAGAINYALSNKPAVGDIVMSALDEATFQSQRDTSWWLCDGRNAVGTTFQDLTALANIPDMRGTIARGKDNGRGLNPNGDLPIGTYTPDTTGPHKHISDGAGRVGFSPPYGDTGSPSFSAIDVVGESFTSPVPLTSVPTSGSAETAPKTVTVNFFIKVNV